MQVITSNQDTNQQGTNQGHELQGMQVTTSNQHEPQGTRTTRTHEPGTRGSRYAGNHFQPGHETHEPAGTRLKVCR